MGPSHSREHVSQNVGLMLSVARQAARQQSSPLEKEREDEEKTFRLISSMNEPQITKVYFTIDSDKDFSVILEGGQEPGRKFAICVVLQDNMNITCRECQAMQTALRLAERGTVLTESQFTSWRKQMEKFGSAQVGRNSQGILILNVRPKPLDDKERLMATLPGIVNKTGLTFDDDGDAFVCFSTDAATYILAISLEMKDRSFSDKQCQATCNALSIGEQGDKMDDSIFLQYCARMQKKYKLLKVTETDGVKFAFVLPSSLDARAAGVTLESSFVLPPVTEGKVEWSDSTQKRVIVKLALENPSLLRALMGEEAAEAAVGAVREAARSGGESSSTPVPRGDLPSYNGGKVAATELIKKSGQADVYRGTMPQGKKTLDVAIKIFHNQADWGDCKQELMTLLRISGHPNVMDVLDFFEVPKPAFVMRFINGGDLHDHISKNGRFSPSKAAGILEGMGQGLKHLHDNHIVHRDLKSPNVMLERTSDNNLRPILIDLGLGRLMEDDGTKITNGLKGTPVWMAPEMMTNNEWSPKTDMYALGIIIWEMMTSEIPYTSMGLVQIISHVSNGGRPDVKKLQRAGVSQEQQQLMQDLWATDPHQRPSADEYLARLEFTFPMSGRSGSSGQRGGSSRPSPQLSPRTPSSHSRPSSSRSSYTPPQEDYVQVVDSPEVPIRRQTGRSSSTSSNFVMSLSFRDPCTGNNAIYSGEVNASRVPNGFGMIQHSPSDSECFLGCWNNGELVGHGIRVWGSGEKYFGPWEHGQPCGIGVRWFANGELYFGNFVDGNMEGYGRLVGSDGSVYEGTFELNTRSGYGALYSTNGGISYRGNWVDGMRDPSTDAFEPILGRHVREMGFKDRWDMTGLYTGFVDASRKPNGWGLIRYSKENTRESLYAEFRAGETAKRGVYVWGNGQWYIGDWSGASKNGQGIDISNDGAVYMGDYSGGQRQGNGIVIAGRGAGTLYHGGVQRGKPHGQGTLYTMDGSTIHRGRWQNGMEA